jgi:hypothetical protein
MDFHSRLHHSHIICRRYGRIASMRPRCRHKLQYHTNEAALSVRSIWAITDLILSHASDVIIRLVDLKASDWRWKQIDLGIVVGQMERISYVK